MHVDGFRFDLASILTRSTSSWDAVNVYGNSTDGDVITTGTPLTSPPLVDMISNDPILCGVKLIAEAWVCGGKVSLERFFGDAHFRLFAFRIWKHRQLER